MSVTATSPDEPDPDDVLRVLAAVSGMDFLPRLPAPSSIALSLLPRSVALRFAVAPVTADPELCVAISDPLSFDLIDSVRFSLRRELEFVVAPPAEVQRIIVEFYPQSA
jgi:hypothetical protein